ncbi:MAG: cytochrome c oxidase subunit 3 [Halofilum sp. (in: g-proteobacteria)]|nr:cytochrome c oxidase subunit 3 [Halofilum sp. (in: g-proteobacteria)]
MTAAAPGHGHYYVPHQTRWPILGSIGLTLLLSGFAAYLNGSDAGVMVALVGAAFTLYMVFGWFGTVIGESEKGFYKDWEDRSFRMGMGWFIFSEVMFFAAFFGALFYARVYAVPWLGGEGSGAATQAVLHEAFQAAWPTNGPADVGGAFRAMGAWGLPAINTAILLSSGVTVTLAHWALKHGQRGALVLWLTATWLLGGLFVGLQAFEYYEAYAHLNLTLGTGIYGSTFFMLTGFHGFHVTLGAIMLIVITLRAARGHFTPQHHFAFEAVAWYWHFVDVVWLGLFVFVYWL